MALIAAISLSACDKPHAVTLPPPIVEVMEIGTSVVPITTTLIGQLDSPQNVEVRARVEGFIDEARFTEGVEIQQGEILFELDPKPYLERLAAANGSMAEANAALNKYQKDVARLAPLVERRAIPQQDLDNALASVDVGKAGVITAQARVESAQLDVGYCEIRSPITGLIGAKQVSIGELVGKGEPTLLATLSTLVLLQRERGGLHDRRVKNPQHWVRNFKNSPNTHSRKWPRTCRKRLSRLYRQSGRCENWNLTNPSRISQSTKNSPSWNVCPHPHGSRKSQ